MAVPPVLHAGPQGQPLGQPLPRLLLNRMMALLQAPVLVLIVCCPLFPMSVMFWPLWSLSVRPVTVRV